MSSSSPLNPHPQDAAHGHKASTGAGSAHPAAAGRHDVHHADNLIRQGYVPVRQLSGKVIAVFGEAYVRDDQGHVRPLHAGETIHKGEVVLTAQDGIVQIEDPRNVAIADNGPIDIEPAAGPIIAGAPGSLEPGLRVDRDYENVSPLSMGIQPPAAAAQPPVQPLQIPVSAPHANPDSEVTPINTPVTFDPRSNDTSTTQLNIVAVAGQPIDPTHSVTLPQGTVAMNPDGTLTFTPNHNFQGSLTFTYTDQNTTGQTSSSTVTVEVQNHVPVAVNDSFNGTEDVPVTGNLAANDTPSTDGGNVWSLTTGPSHGTVTVNADGTFTYVPAAHYSGPDSFTYTITDADGSKSTATATINLAPMPLANPDTFQTLEDAPLTGNLGTNDTVPAGGGNTWSLTTGPEHGTVVVNPDGTFIYIPNVTFNGPDTFTYTVTDAAGSTSTATVTVNVVPVDFVPVANPDSVTLLENTSVSGSLQTNDFPSADGGNVWSLATGPAHGSVVVHPDGTYTYTPTANYNGPDSFTYTITDADGSTSTTTVTIGVTPVPLAAPDVATATENVPLHGSVATNDTPSAGETNTWALDPDHGPAHGTVVMNPDGTYTYTPATGYTGTDTFSYTITDQNGHTATSTVTLTVAPATPVAAPDVGTGNENSPISGNLASNDTPVAGETNTWALDPAHGPAHGTVVVNPDGTYVYTPTTGYNGPDTFSYTITDGSGQTSTATVTLTVTPIAPVAVPDAGSGNENSPISGNLATNDTPVAGETNTWALDPTHGPAHGTVVVNPDGTYTYTPTTGYNGPDTFSYTVTDGSGQTSTATVTLTVAPIAPVAVLDTGSGVENSPISGNLASNDTPVAGETNTWALDPAHGPAHGTVVVNPDGTYVYTPTTGYNGPDTFSYTITDGSGQTSTATVTLTVTPIAPVAVPDTGSGVENSPISGNLATNDTPVAGENNTWAIDPAHEPAHGTVVVNPDGTYVYTPTAGYHGPDTFSYTITDGSGLMSTATVTLTVAPIAPVAAPDTGSGVENAPISGNLATNDTPVAGETNTWAIDPTHEPAHGTVVVNPDGTYVYTPTAGYHGPDTFSYTITDGSGLTSTATVTLTVAPIAPVAAPDTGSGVENAPISGNLATNDTPVAGETNTWAIDPAHEPAHGTVVVNPDGTYVYTPAQGYTGPDTFSYTITDGSGLKSTATVTLTVTPIAPVAAADAFHVAENATVGHGALTASVATNDTPVAGEDNTWTITSQAAHGTVTPAADFATTGNFTYVPLTGFVGTDTFTYKITDASGQTATATATITVDPISPIATNDAYHVNENATAGNGALAASVAANDTPVAGEKNTWSIASQAAHGTVTPDADFATTGKFTYVPTTGFVGTDTFTYTITDASGKTSTATATITVDPISPVATNDAYHVNENATAGNGALAASVAANDTPVAGEKNTWSIASQAAHGTVTPDADFATTGKFTYVPTTGFVGTDTFTYTITDASGKTSTATATITVDPISPVATNDAYHVNENATAGNGALAASVAANDTPVAGEKNTWSIASQAAHGTVTPDADFATTGKFTYVPTTGFVGTDTFTYTITDASGKTSTATATITVDPISPVATNDAYHVNENASGGALAGNVASNDTPVAGEKNTWAITSQTTHGTVTPAADFATTGKFTYVPQTGYVGTDTFTYTITDASGKTATATATITVDPVAPAAVNDSYHVLASQTSITGNVSTNDQAVLGENDTWKVDPSHTVAHGSLTLNPDGTFTYTPTAGYVGTDTFSYTITNANNHLTSEATVTINVDMHAPVLTETDKNYELLTNFEVPKAAVPYQDLAVTALTNVAANAGTSANLAGTNPWLTDNGGHTVEIGTVTTYGSQNMTGVASDNQIIELEQNINDASNLYTTLSTKQGELYTLSFDFAARGNLGGQTNSVIYVYWEGQLVDTLNSQSTTLSHYTLSLIAGQTGDSKLEFVAGDSNSFGGLLDNIDLKLTTNTGVAGYVVNLPGLSSTLADTSGNAEKLVTTISAVPVGVTLTDGTHSFTGSATLDHVDVSTWSLTTLTMTGAAAGDVTLHVTGVATDTITGQSATSSQDVTVHVAPDTNNVYGTAGNDVMEFTTTADGSHDGSNTRWGLDGNDTITAHGTFGATLVGGAGNDTLIGSTDTTTTTSVLDGGAGNDVLRASAHGNDILSGGSGDDVMYGGGADTFKWQLGDQGTVGHAAQDMIYNFTKADALDLRDLLHNETRPAGTSGAGDLTNYLHFSFDGSNTVIDVSSEGKFVAGESNTAADNLTDQKITLVGVDLVHTNGTTNTDAQIIQTLLNQHQLITNGH